MRVLRSIGDLEAMIDAIPSPIFIKDLHNRIVLLNAEACRMFGLSQATVAGRSVADLWPDLARALLESDQRALANGQDEAEHQVVDEAGLPRTVVTVKRVIELADREKLIVGVSTDVTAYREAEAHSLYLASHDPLTGLPNRALFNDRLEQSLLRPRPDGEQCALLSIDLDRFKEVNDTHGHLAGDALVRDFAGRLTAIVRTSDLVARLGGDEFAVLLHGVKSAAQVEEICQRILNAASRPFDVVGTATYISASIGVVILSGHDLSRVDLIRQADMALYRAKSAGPGRFRIFESAMDENLRQRRRIETELRSALHGEAGLTVHYQPILSLEDDRIVAFEALVRWHHPELGPLVPSQFIPVAEETGLINPLGDKVLTEACQTMAQWPGMIVAVNLSAIQLRDPDLARRIIGIIEQTGFDPGRLQLEITESAVLDAEAEIAETLNRLRGAGVSIALDDFGTGYSSLSHLREFKVDKVKIDRSFIQHLGQMEDSAAIVQAITTIGKALGILVTAEGVETVEQRNYLHTKCCDEVQGYWVARPLPADAISGFMQAFERQSGPL